MPSFMFASEVMEFTEEEIQTLQKLDNKVYRAILEVPSYTASCATRSEVGASSSKARDIKTKILFVKHMLQDGNDLLREIFLNEFYENETKYVRKIKRFIELLDINLHFIETKTIGMIKKS